ncbi:hypothetical protein TrCOL_g4368 [Triparma columacea]|uniref:Leucine-rich repeat-containing N-terminal plant-type domain-containing protein n=1 Tax=Triparma columacea TaxID=722753 RepID=A0A9W7GIH4_9STRA|nr:hypothetical protein TrCOL_g4368 [Triparma columacea]
MFFTLSVLSLSLGLCQALKRSVVPPPVAHAWGEASDVEKQALVDLYYSTNGDGWFNSSGWLEGDPCLNHWYGVDCNQQGVVGLGLESNNLTGSLRERGEEAIHGGGVKGGGREMQTLNPPPPSIGDLFALQSLVLRGGNIGDSIPDSLGNLKNVTHLELGDNKFVGEIPASVGSMTKLVIFYGANNQLEGNVPQFTNCKALQQVWLYENNLSGELPSFSTNVNLRFLIVRENNLSGRIPSFQSNVNLLVLDLHGNNLSGQIPSFKSNVNLQRIILYDNDLSGPIPSLESNVNLLELYLNDNDLSGPFPSFQSNVNLQQVGLYSNNLSGPLPSFESNANLQNLEISDNSLSGLIPSFQFNENLKILFLDGNNFSGPIPSFESNANLQYLDLSNNRLSGSLPPFTSNPLLKSLYFYNNQLSGPLPPDFSATPLLQFFFAHNNDFSGTLSPTLFDLKNITSVILSGNAKLKGTLPSVLYTPSLTNLVIEGCAFTGPLPKTITSPLSSFYLAGNSFTSSIPALPPTIRDVSLAYNQITGSLPDSFFSDTPSLTSFDVRHNKIGGTLPTSLSALTNLVDLKLDLNDFSGAIPPSVSNWPVFTANSSNTTVLFGNVWSCPVPNIVREHSNEDPGHAYSCGSSEFVTPAILASAAGALFVVAVSFTKQCENIRGLIGTYKRGRHEVISDACNIVNIGHACYKLVLAVLLASIGLSFTYWNADSNFEMQPTFLKLSLSLKLASNKLILPLLAVTTLLLLYFINWGWNLRFEGHKNLIVQEASAEKKKRLLWRDSLKLFGIFAYTMFFVVAFDFFYVFYVATDSTISPSNKAFANTALSQFKSTLLSERWAAKESMKLFAPKKRFNYLVFAMSVILLLNALVVPSILILLLDERCFKYKLVQQEPHEADVPITYCRAINTNGDPICPDPKYFNDGYVTNYYATTFNYPWSLSNQCGSAVIQAYSPVVILELLFSGFLQPALWWLCIDGGKAQVVKWMMLTIGMSLSLALPQVVNLFADNIDTGDILPGDWALVLLSAGVFLFVFLVGWGASKLRKEDDAEEEEEQTMVPEASESFYLPPINYLLDTFNYNIDEDRVFGQQENFKWPLKSSVMGWISNSASSLLDWLGFAKSNVDDPLYKSMDDFVLEEELEDGEEEGEMKKEEDTASEIDLETSAAKTKQNFGRYLPYTYANFVKNIALIFTFGLASPCTALIGSIGLLCRLLSLLSCQEIYGEEESTRGGRNCDRRPRHSFQVCHSRCYLQHWVLRYCRIDLRS